MQSLLASCMSLGANATENANNRRRRERDVLIQIIVRLLVCKIFVFKPDFVAKILHLEALCLQPFILIS